MWSGKWMMIILYLLFFWLHLWAQVMDFILWSNRHIILFIEMRSKMWKFIHQKYLWFARNESKQKYKKVLPKQEENSCSLFCAKIQWKIDWRTQTTLRFRRVPNRNQTKTQMMFVDVFGRINGRRQLNINKQTKSVKKTSERREARKTFFLVDFHSISMLLYRWETERFQSNNTIA